MNNMSNHVLCIISDIFRIKMCICGIGALPCSSMHMSLVKLCQVLSQGIMENIMKIAISYVEYNGIQQKECRCTGGGGTT